MDTSGITEVMNTKDSSWTKEGTVMVSIGGKVERSTKGSGTKARSKAKAF